MKSGPKKGHGNFQSSNFPITPQRSPSGGHRLSDPPTFNSNHNFPTSGTGGHRLSDHSNLIGNPHKIASSVGGHRLSDHPNFIGNPHKITSSTGGRRLSDSPSQPMYPNDQHNIPNPSLSPNSGPKRGNLQGQNSMHNWSLIENNKASGRTIVPLQEDENGKFHLVPNEGPKRGISIGPSAFHSNPLHPPQNGPKRGVGYMNVLDQLNPNDRRAVEFVNAFRKENNLSPLKYSKMLSDIAMPHTLDMLNQKVPLGHDGFKERSQKVPSYITTGENVAYEYGDSDPMRSLFEGWKNSPGHRKNMLGNFNYIGVAFANRGDLWYGTQFFALM